MSDLSARALETVLSSLETAPGDLYGILDAARDPGLFRWIESCREEKQSLFDGPAATELEEEAPYLIRFSHGSSALRELVSECWGASCGIFLSSPATFPDVRKHLRRFLRVEFEGEGEVYFRFYDPRILRAFLPSCTSQQASGFFGPVMAFHVEGEDGESLLSHGLRGSLVTTTVKELSR
ncbi:MAG: DUF4123 domain-containing protein [Thermoanaerobaculia bacterium]|nr:DUF4123 domain-containing protein [Thermoanaerobaculia bacterium]